MMLAVELPVLAFRVEGNDLAPGERTGPASFCLGSSQGLQRVRNGASQRLAGVLWAFPRPSLTLSGQLLGRRRVALRAYLCTYK